MDYIFKLIEKVVVTAAKLSMALDAGKAPPKPAVRPQSASPEQPRQSAPVNNAASPPANNAAPQEKPRSCKTLNIKDMYIPDKPEPQRNEIRVIELSEKQARELGYSFHRKSKSVRITGYRGKATEITLPGRIGGLPVNEIGRRAFYDSCISSVEIPDSIKEIGAEAFMYSSVKRAVFGEGVRVLPEMAFYSCRNLETVLLPTTLSVIGDSAFCSCGSLGYIVIPRSVGKIGSAAFNSSGLNGFAASAYSLQNADGIAFAYTPMHRNYKVILVPYIVTKKILLVGMGAEIEFTDKVTLLKNSVCAACKLDFSRCAYVRMENAFCPGSYNRQRVEVIIPPNAKDLDIPERINAVYPDGKRYANLVDVISSRGDHVRVRFNGYIINGRTVELAAKELVIEIKHCAEIREHAFDKPQLQRLELIGVFYADGELFSPKCAALREVRWTDDKDVSFVQYVPPSELVGERIHRELLKAFRRKSRKVFFDREIVDKIFRHGYDMFGGREKRELNQRQKILLALDVLGSSPELYSNDVSPYSDYLRTHRRYAGIVCGKLAGSYPEYGMALAKLFEEE